MVRKRPVQFTHQTADRQHLSDRDSMKPDQGRRRASLFGNQPSANPSYPLRYSFAVLFRGRHSPQPPRRSGQQGRQERHVVEKDNHARRITVSCGLTPQMIQSTTMRVLRGLPTLVVWLALPAGATDHTPPPIQPATAFAAVEVHEDEKVAIA